MKPVSEEVSGEDGRHGLLETHSGERKRSCRMEVVGRGESKRQLAEIGDRAR